MSNWISVKDGLPRRGHYVLGVIDGTAYCLARLDSSGRLRSVARHTIEDVNFWMPLPMLPQIRKD